MGLLCTPHNGPSQDDLDNQQILFVCIFQRLKAPLTDEGICLSLRRAPPSNGSRG